MFVWWSRDKHQDLNVVQDYYKKLCLKFPSKATYLLLIEYGEREENIFLENNRILISRFNNILNTDSKFYNAVMGNKNNNLKIFSQIKMNRTLKWKLKYILYCFEKIFIEIIPVRKIKADLRHRLKAKYYKDAL